MPQNPKTDEQLIEEIRGNIPKGKEGPPIEVHRDMDKLIANSIRVAEQLKRPRSVRSIERRAYLADLVRTHKLSPLVLTAFILKRFESDPEELEHHLSASLSCSSKNLHGGNKLFSKGSTKDFIVAYKTLTNTKPSRFPLMQAIENVLALSDKPLSTLELARHEDIRLFTGNQRKSLTESDRSKRDTNLNRITKAGRLLEALGKVKTLGSTSNSQGGPTSFIHATKIQHPKKVAKTNIRIATLLALHKANAPISRGKLTDHLRRYHKASVAFGSVRRVAGYPLTYKMSALDHGLEVLRLEGLVEGVRKSGPRMSFSLTDEGRKEVSASLEQGQLTPRLLDVSRKPLKLQEGELLPSEADWIPSIITWATAMQEIERRERNARARARRQGKNPKRLMPGYKELAEQLGIKNAQLSSWRVGRIPFSTVGKRTLIKLLEHIHNNPPTPEAAGIPAWIAENYPHLIGAREKRRIRKK